MEMNKSKLIRVNEISVRQQMLRNIISSDGAGIARVYLSVYLNLLLVCARTLFYFYFRSFR